MTVWAHQIRFCFFVFKLKNESPFGVRIFYNYHFTNITNTKFEKNLFINDNEHCIESLGVLWQRTLGDKFEAMKNIIAAVGTKLEYVQPWFLFRTVATVFIGNDFVYVGVVISYHVQWFKIVVSFKIF